MPLIPFFVFLFALFPLTDTDIWWHLSCAREWVTAWTPVRTPVINVHYFFQQVVCFVYNLGGTPLLVIVKSVMWAIVFALFMRPFHARIRPLGVCFSVLAVFTFRYFLEIRPVLFSLLILGVYWNLLPSFFNAILSLKKADCRCMLSAIAVILLQWCWCKTQGLFIVGPLFALACFAIAFVRNRRDVRRIRLAACILFIALLFIEPFFHSEGLGLFLYPFGLFDRLVGITESAEVFSRSIAENRSPFLLLMAKENIITSSVMVALSFVMIFYGVLFFTGLFCRKNLRHWNVYALLVLYCFVSAILTLVAERNFILLLPSLITFFMLVSPDSYSGCVPRFLRGPYFAVALIALVVGFFYKSFNAYSPDFISRERVPVAASRWMALHPHAGRLFNDDRAGGYLSFVNPRDSVYIDGRFILKTAEFFERYLEYGKNPSSFIRDADSCGVDRVLLPVRYYARHWEGLLRELMESGLWNVSFADSFYVVLDRVNDDNKSFFLPQ